MTTTTIHAIAAQAATGGFFKMNAAAFNVRDRDVLHLLARLDVPDSRWNAAARGEKFTIGEIDRILAAHSLSVTERIKVKRALEFKSWL